MSDSAHLLIIWRRCSIRSCVAVPAGEERLTWVRPRRSLSPRFQLLPPQLPLQSSSCTLLIGFYRSVRSFLNLVCVHCLRARTGAGSRPHINPRSEPIIITPLLSAPRDLGFAGRRPSQSFRSHFTALYAQQNGSATVRPAGGLPMRAAGCAGISGGIRRIRVWICIARDSVPILRHGCGCCSEGGLTAVFLSMKPGLPYSCRACLEVIRVCTMTCSDRGPQVRQVARVDQGGW